MNMKTKIGESQRELLNHLAAFEASIAELYDEYAVVLPSDSEFWRTLASEERVHEVFMRGMSLLLDRGFLFYNLGRFDIQSVDALAAEIAAELVAAKTRDAAVTASHALGTAFFIEKSIIDGHFYQVAESSAPEFSIIATHLFQDAKIHLKRVRSFYLSVQRSKQGVPSLQRVSRVRSLKSAGIAFGAKSDDAGQARAI
jgi:hypothetical protein